MSIATAIATKQQQVADSYTAVSNKGGTLPATQNLTNLATAISSIPSGGITPTGTLSITANGTYDVTNYASADVSVSGGGSEKYGATIDTFLGDVVANGVLQPPSEQSDLVFTGVTDVANYGLFYKFSYSKVKSISFPDLEQLSGSYGCNYMFNYSALTSVSLPNLSTISGSNACSNMFLNCSLLTSVSLPNLTTVSGVYGCNYMFSNCSLLTSVSLPNLTTISGFYGCNYMFNSSALTSVSLPNLSTISGSDACRYMFNYTALTSVSLPNLSTISGSNACYNMFSFCQNLTDVYFSALTTSSFGSYKNQFNKMMTGTGKKTTHTLHFPSNLESTISGLSGYPLFGGTSGYVVCAFDLPETS